MVWEDVNTDFQDIAPVSKMMQMVCMYHADGPKSESLEKHAARRADVMWVGPDGMRCNGTNGSQLWDLVFIAQALVTTGLVDLPENKASAIKMLEWLEKSQIRENPKHHKNAYRFDTKGAWLAGFSFFPFECMLS
jgi:lanosterol synthase